MKMIQVQNKTSVNVFQFYRFYFQANRIKILRHANFFSQKNVWIFQDSSRPLVDTAVEKECFWFLDILKRTSVFDRVFSSSIHFYGIGYPMLRAYLVFDTDTNVWFIRIYSCLFPYLSHQVRTHRILAKTQSSLKLIQSLTFWSVRTQTNSIFIVENVANSYWNEKGENLLGDHRKYNGGVASRIVNVFACSSCLSMRQQSSSFLVIWISWKLVVKCLIMLLEFSYYDCNEDRCNGSSHLALKKTLDWSDIATIQMLDRMTFYHNRKYNSRLDPMKRT
jgi:hypothetical protein